MAAADELLRDAQYAFQCISFGESADNARNRRRASSISRKIIRKYPGTMEASEALAILRRLGEEAYSSNISLSHQHISQQQHHAKPRRSQRKHHSNATDSMNVVQTRTFVTDSDVDDVSLDWVGVITWLAKLPKALIGVVFIFGVFLFGIFGPFLFIPLVALVLFTGPLRNTMGRKKQRDMNERIAKFNLFIADRHRGGST